MSKISASPIVLALCVCAVMSASAQQQPDAGSLSREAERREQTLPQRSTPPTEPGSTVAPAAPTLSVRVDGYVLSGVTLVPETELQKSLDPYKGRTLSFKELQKAADAVAAAYRQRGYLVRASLPEQDLSTGMVKIAVVEGRLSGLRVDTGGKPTRLQEATVRRFMLARQQMGQPLQADALQRGINLVNDLPGMKADLVLEPGQRDGESQAIVRVREGALVNGHVQLDNTGVRSTGSVRLLGNLNLDDPLGLGDQAGLNLLKSEGSTYGRLVYGLPLGGDGLRLNGAASMLDYAYNASGTRFAGTAHIASLSMTYPLHRASDSNLSIGLNVDSKRFENTAAGVELNNKRARVGTLSLSGDLSDALGGGGVWLGGLNWVNGDFDLSRNAGDFSVDQAGAQCNGSFTKWQWNLARLQQISPRSSGWLAVSGQRAGKNLDSSEKFGIGGPGGVRAYPAGEASGDDGWLLTAEWRYQLDANVQLSGFYDRGGIQRDHQRYSGTANPNTVVLSGAGVGARWMLGGDLVLSASAAWRIGENPLRDAGGMDSDGTRRKPRLWLSVSKTL